MKLVILSLTFAFGAAASAQILATVGGAKITSEEFKTKLEDIHKQATNPPTPEVLLEDLVRYEIGAQEADKLKLQNEPQVKERMKQVLYNALLEKQLGKTSKSTRTR